MKKGYEESQKPGTVVVMLIPARTDTSYFHDYILHGKAAEIRFLRGRLKFTDEDGNAKDSAPFPSAVIVWRSPDMGQSLRDMVLDLIKGEPMTANEIAATLSDLTQPQATPQPAAGNAQQTKAAEVAAGTKEQEAAEPEPTGKPLDLKNRKKKPEPEKAEAAAGDLVPGRDFDPDTGEVLKDGHPVDDQKKIVAIGQRAAQA